MTSETETREATRGGAKKWLLWGLKIAGTLAGFGYIAWIVEPDELGGAIARVSVWAFAGACLLTGSNMFVGAVRWRILLAAYGAPKKPSILHLARVYLVGFFYNNYLPGGLGGDVVRGIVTRESFGERGVAASGTVVFVERVLGLSGLLLLVSTTLIVRPLENTDGVLPFSALLLLAAVVAVAAIAMGRRLAPRLPARLAKIAASLPAIEKPGAFALALAISLVTQSVVAMTGYVLMASVSTVPVGPFDALVIVPLAMASAFFPFSVGGAGVREGAFTFLCASALGMAESDAVAASLLIWFSQLAVGAIGGVVQLVAPLTEKK
jgi:uncharacterized membrane protein YbhN (UPF0104 family)